MEEERTHREIELRSEEVQEVMGKIPPAILRYGIVVLLGIMAVVLAGSACFSYPDTVETEFTLTTQNPPAYIMAQSAGRIEQLYTANSQPVGKGDMLGVIENVARTEDLFVLRERMKEWKQGGSRTEQVGTLFFHRIAELGSVQAAYSSCLLAWNNYLQHMQESSAIGIITEFVKKSNRSKNCIPMIFTQASGPYPSDDRLPRISMITPTKTVAFFLLQPISSSNVDTALSVSAIELVTAANKTNRKNRIPTIVPSPIF